MIGRLIRRQKMAFRLVKTVGSARRLGLVSFAILALTLTACQGSPEVSVAPIAGGGLVAQPAEVDLGRVPLSQEAHARFTLVNQGTNAVRLNPNIQVQTLEGCWPAQPSIGSMDLKPGQSTTVDYPFMMPPGMGGPHHFKVTIQTDSPQTPSITLDIRANAG